MSKTNSFHRNNSPYLSSTQKDLSIWEWEDVNKWLINNNMQQYLELFEKHQVNGYDLCYLTNEDLNEMQLNNFHDRNLVLKNIRLMTLDQLKIQITHEEKTITVQLDFDPNFTAENLVASLMELFKIQTGLVFMSTYDNEILMPNLKMVDLILLNPKKYKNLRIHSSSNLNTISYENKKFEPKVDGGFSSYNTYNISSTTGQTANISNTANVKQKTYDRDAAFATFDKDPTANEKGINDSDDLQYNKDLSSQKAKENEDLLISSKNPLDDHSYTGNNKDLGYTGNEYSNNTHSYKNYTSYKEKEFGGMGVNSTGLPANSGITPGPSNITTSIKNYENTLNSITNKYNQGNKDNSKIHNDTYEDLKLNQNKNKTFDRNDRDRFSYGDDKDSSKGERAGSLAGLAGMSTGNSSNNPSNNFIHISDNFNYDKNSQKGYNREKDDYKNLSNLTGTPVQNNDLTAKYNYSERFKEDLNRQRFSSEKRNYRNNQHIAKADEKVDDFTSLLKNDNSKFDKISEKFSDKSTEKFASRYNQYSGNPDFNSIYSEKEKDFPVQNNNTDIKSKVNTMRSQLNSFNTKEGGYKFNANRDNLNANSTTYNQNSDAEIDSSNPRKLNRNNSTGYSKLK